MLEKMLLVMVWWWWGYEMAMAWDRGVDLTMARGVGGWGMAGLVIGKMSQ